MQLFRYPGGKAKLCKEIGGFINSYYNGVALLPYREPFFGGGSVGLHLMTYRSLPGAWLNDYDAGIAAIWDTVANHPDSLCAAIRCFEPSVDAFYELKEQLVAGTITDKVVLAASKIAIHQISFSGLGTKSGGPLGGKDQGSDYGIDCRWNPDTLCNKIKKINRMLVQSKTKVTNLDFAEVIDAKGKAFVYLDPPYYVKGGELYQHAFQHEDHLRLAACLERTKNPWLLSYDDAPEIREMFKFAAFKEVVLSYTISGAREKTELLIYPHKLAHLFEEDRGINILDD
jgi:DNA adenine methylase